jgi:cyclase
MKRLIFSILYDDGYFILSRNFRKQKVGELNWLFRNYNLVDVSFGIDEIIILDVSKKKNFPSFCKIVEKISAKVFIPVTAGGGIKSLDNVKALQSSGADKILLNKLFYCNPKLCKNIADIYGKQFVVGCIDYKIINKQIKILYDKGLLTSQLNLTQAINRMQNIGIGEIILQSIDKDGTGEGLDIGVLRYIKNIKLTCPLILKGGIGKSEHIYAGLKLNNVDAVCTANLFNFIGDSFLRVKNFLLKKNIDVINWGNINLKEYNNIFKNNNDN